MEAGLVLWFLISVIITWCIGLAVPLIIRYVIIKRSISKKAAIITVIVNGIMNLFVFIAMGSQSKSHMVVYIMGMVSYWMLTRKSKAKRITTENM